MLLKNYLHNSICIFSTICTVSLWRCERTGSLHHVFCGLVSVMHLSVLLQVHSFCVMLQSPLLLLAVLCYAVLCAVLCCAVLCCAGLCYAVLCYAMLCCAVLCCAMLSCAVLCYAVLCCAVLSMSAILYYTL